MAVTRIGTKAGLLFATALATPVLPAVAQDRPPPAAPADQPPATIETMRAEFRDPPGGARPRVWWHWMNGNISKEGIAADMAWMKRVGIGGLQNFDVDLSTDQVVPNRLVYMTPAWRDAFRFAATEAERQGLELAIASSPGWSETGGPWVQPEDAMKKLSWSETVVTGGRPVRQRLPQPPATTGPFQDMVRQPDISDLIAARSPERGPDFYRDAKVLAVRIDPLTPLPQPMVSDGAGKAIVPGRQLPDGGVGDVVLGSVFAPQPPVLMFDYQRPVTVRSATLHIFGGAIPLLGPLLDPVLEYGSDGKAWTTLTRVALQESPVTVSFPAVTARYFRVVVRMPHDDGDHAAQAAAEKQLAMENVFGRAIGGLLGKPVRVGRFQLHPEAKVDQFETKAGFGIVADYFALPKIADDASGAAPAEVVDLTGRMTGDGTLDWTPPPGRWRILRMGYSLIGKLNHPAPAEATGLEVDKYDGAAVSRYLDRYLANYRSTVGDGLLGDRGVRALLTDSIEVGAANWTPQIIDRFKALRGYDPTPWLPALTGTIIGDRARSDAFLYDFRRTLGDLMASEHYRTVADTAHRNGLKVYGEAIEGNRSSFGDDMAMRRHADYPMGAMWAFPAGGEAAPSYAIDVRGAASVAHLYGQNIVAAESMTATMAPWAFGPADLKHIIDLEFLLGVNRPVVHTSVHVPVEDRKPGLSLGGIGQFFNRNESWAELATPWVSYLSRNAYLLQQGRNVADIAYFYGEEAPLSGLFGKTPVTDMPTGYAYDFVNPDALFDALSNDGNELVSVGGARYRLLYLGGSSQRMTLKTLERIARLAEGGATIVGLAPQGTPGLGDDPAAYAALVRRLWSGTAVTAVGQGQVIATRDVSAALERIGQRPDVAFTGTVKDSDIPFVHRRSATGDTYFLVNRKDRRETVEARFRVAGRVPERWRAETGTTEPLAYRIENGVTIVPLTFDPRESYHVVFSGDAATPTRALPAVRSVTHPLTTAPWQVTFEAGRGAPPSVPMERLAPLDEHADPRIRYFSGIATYANRFTPPRGWRSGQPLTLDLGEAREVAEVRVNGAHAGYAWHAPYTIDIGSFVRAGRANRIEIRVANLWVNRLIRDADPAVRDKVAWASVQTYRPTATLRRSGLIGPVTLTTPTRK